MNRAPVKPGDVLADKYRVDHVLGIGGMGMVVAATHLELLEPRALKFILSSALADADTGPRFLREARAAAKLKSEHIAKVYDVGRLEDGAPYLVMEYLEGSDLDALLKKVGSVPVPVAALYALQVCSALAEAHAAGIVHRDLKPANLFLTQRTDGSSCIKVLDFGISKVLNEGADVDVTKTRQLLGSPLYMSPEQMQSTRSADTRSDIWSLGVILYKLVTGSLPFAAQSIVKLVELVLATTPTPPSKLNPALPSGLDAVILRCLRRNRDERYGNVVELAVDLERFAPPEAAAYVKTMGRVFASSASRPRPTSSSATGEDSNRPGPPVGQLRPIAAKQSAPELGPLVNASPALATPTPMPMSMFTPPAGVARADMGIAPPDEMTTAAWGQGRGRVTPRSNLPVILAVVAGIAVLAVVGLVLALTAP